MIIFYQYVLIFFFGLSLQVEFLSKMNVGPSIMSLISDQWVTLGPNNRFLCIHNMIFLLLQSHLLRFLTLLWIKKMNRHVRNKTVQSHAKCHQQLIGTEAALSD